MFEARSKVIARIQSLVQERFGKNYTVECFGSTQYGADSPSSDLDLVIIVCLATLKSLDLFAYSFKDHDRMSGFAPDVDLKTLPGVYYIRI